MNLQLKIWRQKDADSKGKMVDYPISGVEGRHVIPRNVRCIERIAYRIKERNLLHLITTAVKVFVGPVL